MADLLTVVDFPVHRVAVPLVAALELVTTAPESFRWIRVDWNLDGPRIFIDREQSRECRADALLVLAVWTAGMGMPAPTANAVYQTHSESVLDLDDTQIDVLAAIAGVNVLKRDRAAVPLDRVAAVLPPGAGELIESRLVELERVGLVKREPNGWLLRSDPPRRARTGPDTYMTNFGPLSVLVQDGMAESRRLEGWGLHLVETTMPRLRRALPWNQDEITRVMRARPALGPDFDYATSPVIFGGRTGSGPLYVAWDTNLLVDYFDHGAALWRGASLPDTLNEGNYLTMEGLELLLALWVV